MLCALAGPLAAQSPPATPLPPLVTPITLAHFDPIHTRFGFQLHLRWGQPLNGVFPRYGGEVLALPDGRHQVRIRLLTGAVEVDGARRNTETARGEYFFDAERFPVIEFVSDPYSPHLLRDGGLLRGVLTLHGVSRIESFTLEPSACLRPGRECDVVALGSVRRDDYGLDRWRFAVKDRVHFSLRVRLQEPQ